MSEDGTVSPVEWATPFEQLTQRRPIAEVDGDGNVALPPDGTSLDYLRAVYHDRKAPRAVRLRAAVAAAPFEHSKLAVGLTMNGGDFANALEAARKRSGRVRPVLELETAQPVLAPAKPRGGMAAQMQRRLPW